MIAPDAAPIGHIPPLKRIDIRYPSRKQVITRQEIEDNLCREPCHEAYERDPTTGGFRLRER